MYPAPLPTDRTNDTPQIDQHPADHNALAKAINDLVADLKAGRTVAKTLAALDWSTTSLAPQSIDPLAITITPRTATSSYLLRAVLHAGANGNADDTGFHLLAGAVSVGSVGATNNAAAHHRFTVNSLNGQGLEIAHVVIEAVHTPGNVNPIKYVPAINVRTASPVQQVFLNRRSADTVLGCVSTFSVTEL